MQEDASKSSSSSGSSTSMANSMHCIESSLKNSFSTKSSVLTASLKAGGKKTQVMFDLTSEHIPCTARAVVSSTVMIPKIVASNKVTEVGTLLRDYKETLATNKTVPNGGGFPTEKTMTQTWQMSSMMTSRCHR
jgi:hypothetical protein